MFTATYRFDTFKGVFKVISILFIFLLFKDEILMKPNVYEKFKLLITSEIQT